MSLTKSPSASPPRRAALRRTAHRDITTEGPDARFAKAETLLELYASAGCVVTTRLHCALPCLAMQTPVLLLGGAHGPDRFTGLTDLVHNCSAGEFLSGEFQYDITAPPPNPTAHLNLRRGLVERVRSFVTDGPTVVAGGARPQG